jgi:1-deoxy-D-xylulose-5-phosphate synthase
LTIIEHPEKFAHYDLGFVKPLDTELLHEVFNQNKHVVVYEEGTVKGGVGSAILEFAAAQGYTIPVDLEGIPDEFISHGNSKKLLENLGLDTKGICKKLNSLLNKNKE